MTSPNTFAFANAGHVVFEYQIDSGEGPAYMRRDCVALLPFPGGDLISETPPPLF